MLFPARTVFSDSNWLQTTSAAHTFPHPVCTWVLYQGKCDSSVKLHPVQSNNAWKCTSIPPYVVIFRRLSKHWWYFVLTLPVVYLENFFAVNSGSSVCRFCHRASLPFPGLRRCPTSRMVPGSIPGGVTWDFFRGSFRQNHVP